MSDSPWVTLRHAQEAVTNHRPEDAHRLLEPLVAAGYRRAARLARAVAAEYLARANKSLDLYHIDAAWRDLLAAESLAPRRPQGPRRPRAPHPPRARPAPAGAAGLRG